MVNGPKVANVIILSQYFGSSFKTRGAPMMIYILFKSIEEQGACFSKWSFWGELFPAEGFLNCNIWQKRAQKSADATKMGR